MKWRLKTCALVKISVPLLPHGPRNSQGKNGTCPVIAQAIDNCYGAKTGHLISHEWCPFPQNLFQYFKVKCLVVLIIKKISGNSKALRKH